MEVEMCHKIHLELKERKKLTLFANNIHGLDGIVSNLFGYYFWMEWENVFVLGSQVHGDNSSFVDVLVLQYHAVLMAGSQVLIKDCNW